MAVSAATLIERAKGIRKAGDFEKEGADSIAFSPDGRLLAQAQYRTVRLWEVETQRLLWTREDHQCFSLAFSPVGRVLACAGKARHDGISGDDYSISLCDVATGETRRCLSGHNLYVNCIAFSRDGRLLASASDDSTVKLWEVEGLNWFSDKVRQRTFSGHEDTVRSVSLSPAGRLASSSRDNTVRVWDITTHVALRTQQHPDARIVAYSPNGQMLAVSSQSNDLSVMEADTGRLIHQLKQTNNIRAWCWSPDSSVLAVQLGTELGQQENLHGSLVLWHVESEVAIYTEEWPRGTNSTSYLNPIAISPNGRLLATPFFDEEITRLQLWDISSLGVGVGSREEARERMNVQQQSAVMLSEPMMAHLRTLPLSHALLQTPARPAQWLRSAASAGARPPLCIVRDLGALLTQPRDQLALARPTYLPPGLDTSAYLNLLTRLAAHPLLREVSGWDISE
ncbi:MAG TPA: WD40 repeat domain-containing protein, partial [Pyrinomonadaceae bacterium]